MEKVKISMKLFLTGLVSGLLLFSLFRFITYTPEGTHYHANFGLFVDGERFTFEDPTYYEEVSTCTTDGEYTPLGRVHMHDEVNDAMHVHAGTVTWSHFLSNINMSASRTHFQRDSNVWSEPDTQIRYILNGQEVSNIANSIIGDEDKLLIDISNDADDVVLARFTEVGDSAVKLNQENDPVTCSGNSSSLADRFQSILN